MLIAIPVALFAAVWLGDAIACRFPHRRWSLYLPLWVLSMLPLGRAAGPTGAVLAGIPLIAIVAAEGFRENRAKLNAARSLGASEWRIFWWIFLPNGWIWVVGGVLLAWGHWFADQAILAYL